MQPVCISTTWCMGYVRKVAKECPLQAGFCSRRFKRLTNLDRKEKFDFFISDLVDY